MSGEIKIAAAGFRVSSSNSVGKFSVLCARKLFDIEFQFSPSKHCISRHVYTPANMVEQTLK